MDKDKSDIVIVNNEIIKIKGKICKKCEISFSDGYGTYSDVLFVKLCKKHKIRGK